MYKNILNVFLATWDPSFNINWRCLNGSTAQVCNSRWHRLMCWKWWILNQAAVTSQTQRCLPAWPIWFTQCVYYSGTICEGWGCLWPHSSLSISLYPPVCVSFDKTEPVKSEQQSHSLWHCKQTWHRCSRRVKRSKLKTLLIGFSTRIASNYFFSTNILVFIGRLRCVTDVCVPGFKNTRNLQGRVWPCVMHPVLTLSSLYAPCSQESAVYLCPTNQFNQSSGNKKLCLRIKEIKYVGCTKFICVKPIDKLESYQTNSNVLFNYYY